MGNYLNIGNDSLEIQNELLNVIKSIINDNQNDDSGITDIESLIPLAKSHNLLTYLAVYYERNKTSCKVNGKVAEYLESCNVKMIAQIVHQDYALDEMQQAFEEEHIYNMPLKGARTKNLYPDESLRPMGDIDILFKPKQGKLVGKVMSALGYSDCQEGRKHDIFRRNPYIVVETHRDLVATESDFSSYYKNIWEKCLPKEGYSYCYEMRLEDEFIFNIIHMIEHFKEGGAGIKFIMDIYVYDRLDMDRSYLEGELGKLGIFEFYRNISLLARYWFSDSLIEMDNDKKEFIERIGTFIISNGMDKIHENSSDLAVSHGRLAFLLKICFPSYLDMCSMFTWLENKPWLLPFSWILRGVRSLKYRRGNVRLHFDSFKSGDADKGRELLKFYSECGL